MKPPLHTLKLTLLIFIFFCTSAKQLFSRTAAMDSLLITMQYEKNHVKIIQSYFQIGNSYKTEHNDSAFIFYNKALKNAVEMKQDSLIGLGYYYLASFESYRNNYRPALMYADSAIKYLQHTKSKLQLAELKNIKGIIYLKHLNEEKKLNRDAIKNQERTSNILLSAVVILFLFSALVFNRFQLKKKIENQQALITERKRISHELHDNLGSQLCAARLFLAQVIDNNNINNKNLLIENTLGIIDASIKDLRFIMDDLVTPALYENGYIAATTELVNKVNLLRQINFSLSHNGLQQRLEQKKENSLYRITQELITNTLKYAHAKNVTIDVLNRDNNIVLMYEDDGNGFNLQSTKKGYGLNNIQSRSQSLGGTVAFDSLPGAGFRAIIEIPLLYA